MCACVALVWARGVSRRKWSLVVFITRWAVVDVWQRGALGLGACGRGKPPVCFYRGLFETGGLKSGYVGVGAVDDDV